MTTDVSNSSMAVPVVTGALTGALSWASLCVWFAQPLIPNTDDLPTILKEPPPSAAVAAPTPTGPTDPGEQVFTTVCAACHQANAQGLPGAFPPLAGSSWASLDPETPIRIVIKGLSGPIKVNGADFNSMMPPPPGLDDEKIAAVLTYVRSHFGNHGSAITKDQVAAVRAAISSRANPWSSEELSKLRPAEGGAAPQGAPAAPAAAPQGAAAPAQGAAAPAQGAAAAPKGAAAPAQGAAPQAAPTNAQPAGKQL
jgi:mono/diheme cytochrome c family protein